MYPISLYKVRFHPIARDCVGFLSTPRDANRKQSWEKIVSSETALSMYKLRLYQDTIRKPPEFLFSVIRPPEKRLITWAQSAKVMSSLTRVVWWLRTATRVVFYLLWIWKYKIVVNNTFLVPTLTCETTIYDKKTIRVPVLSHQTTRVKTYHLSAKREGDEFFTEGGLVNENSNEGGFLFIMTLKI